MSSPRLRRLAAGLGLIEPAKSFKRGLVTHRDVRPPVRARRSRDATARSLRARWLHAWLLLGAVVGSVLRIPASARYFALGYRYGRQLAPPKVSIPAVAPEVSNPLEAYFDAHIEGPGIWKWRHYFDIYHRHLARFRGQPVHIVEIGVFGGGTLQMWREYFGPRSHIYGVDIDPACTELEREGVEVFIGDQGDPDFWTHFLKDSPIIDIVLDDGGHTPRQQTITLQSLLPHIRPGGVYICEDIHGSFQPFHSFVDGLARPLSAIGMPSVSNPANALHQHIASIHRYPILTVIEKPPSSELLFEAPRRGTQWPVPPGQSPV